jgi:hypothetical protein
MLPRSPWLGPEDAQDFLAHASSLIAYVNRYRAAQIPADFNVRFLEYHWTVNHRKWAYVR